MMRDDTRVRMCLRQAGLLTFLGLALLWAFSSSTTTPTTSFASPLEEDRLAGGISESGLAEEISEDLTTEGRIQITLPDSSVEHVFARSRAVSEGEVLGVVLLLHGRHFTSKNWQEIGTLAFLPAHGFHTIAVDLPGFGGSQETMLEKVDWLEAVISVVVAKYHSLPVVVSPSMSGRFSVPVVLKQTKENKKVMAGFVPIAAVEYQHDFSQVDLPSLILWGSLDTRIGAPGSKFFGKIPKSREYVKQGGKHAWYIDFPHEFHAQLLLFLKSLHK